MKNVPGRAGGSNSTELAALNNIYKKLNNLSSLASSGGATSTLTEQQVQTSELVAINSNILSLLNNSSTSKDIEILLVRDKGNNDTVVQQIREYDQSSSSWSTRYENVNGNSYTPLGVLEYIDPSAALNLMLIALSNILSNTQDNATEATSLIIRNTLITTSSIISNILEELSTEVTYCSGVDSSNYVNFTLGSPVAGSLPSAGANAPGYSNYTTSSINISNTSNDWYTDMAINSSFLNVNIIDVLFDCTIINGLLINKLTVELVETSGIVLDTDVILVNKKQNVLEKIKLSFDNSLTNYNNVFIRIYINGISITSGWEVILNNYLLLNNNSINNIDETVIKEFNTYSNGFIINTNYKDHLNTVYNLSGTFLKIDKFNSLELKSNTLKDINDNITRQVSHNNSDSYLLPMGSDVMVYTGFKEFIFSVVSGTVDVSIGSGPLITYPINLASGGVIVGQSIDVDDNNNNNVIIDSANGESLITIKT